jgi:hypothetical protein
MERYEFLLTPPQRGREFGRRKMMAEWELAQRQPADQLAKLHFFSMMKHQADGDVEFRITVKEFATPEPGMQFLAEADKQVNQNGLPYRPCGWGSSLLKALSDCMREIERFPYDAALQSEGSQGA